MPRPGAELRLDAEAQLFDFTSIAESIQDDICAVFRERARNCEADAGSRAGNDGGLAVQHENSHKKKAGPDRALSMTAQCRRRFPFSILPITIMHVARRTPLPTPKRCAR